MKDLRIVFDQSVSVNIVSKIKRREESWWWLSKEFGTFFGSRVWLLGNGEQNFGRFLLHILFSFDLLLSKFIKWFLSDISSKVFRRRQNYVWFVLSQTSLPFVLKNAESMVLFAIQSNNPWLKHPIKSLLL